MRLLRLNEVEWPWMLYIEMFIAGIAAGAYIIAAILQVYGRGDSRAARAAHLIAFPLMLAATALLIIDLKRPERFWHMPLQNHTLWPMFKWWSPISYGTWLVIGFTNVTFLSFLDALAERGWFRFAGWRSSKTLHGSRWGLLLAVPGALLGVGVGVYSGQLLYATLIPGWAHAPLLAPLFLAIAASTGAAALLLILALRGTVDDTEVAGLRRVTAWLVIWQGVLVVAFFATMGAGLPYFLTPSVRSPLAIVLGVLLGIVGPLLLWYAPHSWRRLKLSAAPSTAGLAVPATLVLVGGLLLRYAIIRGPQHAIGW